MYEHHYFFDILAAHYSISFSDYVCSPFREYFYPLILFRH